ncbi:SDR family NAD(P)-dependent oxidoreductase [Jatrophihabitans sp.]|uniref:SDR family NAD(P)-dependent oxidoreductase n=1 Tax=Jatrophihabitans sp. TaxID=1932789 RepID=UPI0030C6A90D|nr:short-chain dehydorgenase/reductase [Jatrophihabitans sp.]
MQVSGKSAIVVGGASGMGRATAEALAAAGARVAVLDRPGSDGPAVARELDATFVACDVADFAGAEQAIATAVEALGGLHIAVNTAGGGIAMRTLSRNGPHDLDAYRSVIDLNLVGTFNLNRLQASHMAENMPDDDERGVIVNTSSIAAFEGQIGQVAYSAAKAGIAGMALVMARDLGSLGIRVVAIAPSLFATGATAKFSAEAAKPMLAGAAFPQRMGRPSEYAKLALAIIDNPMLNGQCLRLDAGQRFGPR